LIGIVGAVALAAVMVGVFVYEYNNTDDGDGNGTGGTGAFAGLHADGDVDGDGIPNADDDDADGDGIPDTQDDDATVTKTGSGALGPRLEPAMSVRGFVTVAVEESVRSVHVVVMLTPTSPDPTGTSSGFQVTLELEDGTVLETGIGSSSVELHSTEIVPGDVSVVIRPVQGGLGGDWSAMMQIEY
jgi:hypothetical protein